MSAREARRRSAQSAASQAAQHRAKSVAEFCDFYGFSRPTFYAEIAAGRLRTIKVGRRRIVTPQQEQAWVELLEAEQQGAPK